MGNIKQDIIMLYFFKWLFRSPWRHDQYILDHLKRASFFALLPLYILIDLTSFLELLFSYVLFTLFLGFVIGGVIELIKIPFRR